MQIGAVFSLILPLYFLAFITFGFELIRIVKFLKFDNSYLSGHGEKKKNKALKF